MSTKRKHHEIIFKTTPHEFHVIQEIVDRALPILARTRDKASRQDVHMDLAATHANGNPMDFEKLLAADDFNFMHDIFGIRTHLNRETGELGDMFSPRCSARV